MRNLIGKGWTFSDGRPSFFSRDASEWEGRIGRGGSQRQIGRDLSVGGEDMPIRNGDVFYPAAHSPFVLLKCSRNDKFADSCTHCLVRSIDVLLVEFMLEEKIKRRKKRRESNFRQFIV